MNSKNKIAEVAIIGLGYVGLPLALSFGTRKDIIVRGYDKDKQKIKSIERGESYINHIPSIQIKKYIKKNFVENNFEKISQAKIIFLCVPTPLKKNNKPDLSFIEKSLNQIFPYLKKRQAISLESSTYPGTTEELIINKLNKKFRVGKDFFVIYSPEREDPGNKIKMQQIPKVVSGYSEKCLKIGYHYYSKVFKKVIRCDNLKTAEFSKILENVFRSINIGLVNEIKMISDKMNIDIFDIIKIASSKPFGFMPFFPGPGVGGHCIPLDPFYLKWKAESLGTSTKFIQLAHKINIQIKEWIISKIDKCIGGLNKKKILILGAAYKKNIDDCRESPSLDIISDLIKKKSKVQYHDPFVKKLPITRKHKMNMKSIKINKTNIKQFDAIVILTDHDNVNYNLIKKNSKMIFDSRGVYKVNKKIIRI